MYNTAVIVYCSIKISLFCYFSATLEPKHNPTVLLNGGGVEQRAQALPGRRRRHLQRRDQQRDREAEDGVDEIQGTVELGTAAFEDAGTHA